MSQQPHPPLFELSNFRDYVRNFAEAKGRGEFRRIAIALNMHTTLVSQILAGKKCLTEEQAAGLCAHMKLKMLETDYFIKLVQIERAGAEPLKDHFRRHLLSIREEAHEIKSRVPKAAELTENDRALFYSSWQYSLVRLLTDLEKFQTATSIAQRLDLPVSRIQEILDFLLSRGLCTELKGHYRRTGKNTHVEAQSALVTRHHQNWRMRATSLLEQRDPKDLAFTAPISLAKKDLPLVRRILLDAIEKVSQVVEKSPAEEVAYIGIDWLKL